MIKSAEQIANEVIEHEYLIQEIMNEITEDIVLIDIHHDYQDPAEQLLELFT